MSRIIKTCESRHDTVASFEHDAFDEDYVEGPNGVRIPRNPSMILEEARAEAERKVQEAYAEGLKRGIETGEAEFREAVGEAADVIRAAADVLKQSREEYIKSLEPQLVALAGAMAAQILRRESESDPELILRTAQSVLHHVMDQERVILRVNPGDLEVLKKHRISLLEEFDGIENIEILADPEVDQGGCIGLSTGLQVDGRLESQLEIILSQLAE